jgi:uncharacterized membrane protein (UPF0127 family)
MNYKLFPGIFAGIVLLSASCAFASCGPKKLETAELRIERAGAAPVTVRAEMARTSEQRNQGLMYRKSLPDGEGMLFMFDRDEALSFWMKNTLIPLSIAFIASDGTIIEIKDMRPHDQSPVQSSRSARYALETPRGWFGRAGVRPGDKLALNFSGMTRK